MDVFQRFLDIFRAFEEETVEYILVGGFAVVLYGLPRVTQDIDILLELSEKNVQKLKKALRRVFQDNSVEEILFTDIQKYAVVRYGTPEGFSIDIMAHIGEVASYDKIDWQIVETENVPVRVATPESLLELKKNTVRPQDKQDAMFLDEYIRWKKENTNKS